MILKGFIVPGKPQPLLAPEKSVAWMKLRRAFDLVAKEIEALKPDVLLLFSTQWVSVLGHQIQTHPHPKWNLVDQEWHDLGTVNYEFDVDSEFGKVCAGSARARGLHVHTVDYHGFPVDMGSVVATKLLNPKSQIPVSIFSCNMYSDKDETIILSKAVSDALKQQGKTAVAVAVTSFSNRVFHKTIRPEEDRIHSLKDDEWNRKYLQILGEGRLEDASQLAREFTQQASGDSKMKGVWFLAGAMGQTNRYEGQVYEYQPVYGTGAAIVGLTPSTRAAASREFDETDFETLGGSSPTHNPSHVSAGEMNAVSAGSRPNAVGARSDSIGARASSSDGNGKIIQVAASKAPKPVGAYPHARKFGDLLFLSGVGPRQPVTNEIPGGPIKNAAGEKQNYDIKAQTRATIENVKNILEASGASLQDVLDVTVFLVDMDRDFKGYNEVYAEYFKDIQATRTTLAIQALPTPIAVELKVTAKAPQNPKA
ncbi:MAG: hypothetical protein K2X47_19955 [Bdellovibrionales bacterium]|nr:hypothetical protein [Bdellovibrionales bacterium]